MKRNNRSGFTLVEIMIVVAIIGLLAVIAVPGFIRSRQLSQGRAILNNARQIDAAIDQWALESGKKAGDVPNCAAIAEYLKDGSLKAAVAAIGSNSTGGVTSVLDMITISIGNVGSQQVTIPAAAKAALPAVTDWGNY